ncbi:MAG: hypothetical protein Q4D85_12490 [Corynebacterium sp.]|uniref:hypothetical protein n=1 Tax=Corynebacterium sp. TaxID=1720 RepID=UPI0026DB033D|nr:hypothetical protein [Corynebacterium sp.]MDO5099551.1 hypothetical protein [Corynebacterium sp.]
MADRDTVALHENIKGLLSQDCFLCDIFSTGGTVLSGFLTWDFSKPQFASYEEFLSAVAAYNQERGAPSGFDPDVLTRPLGEASEYDIYYSTRVRGNDDVLAPEKCLSGADFREEDCEKGWYPVDVVATFDTHGGQHVAAGEVLWHTHLMLANKNTGDGKFFVDMVDTGTAESRLGFYILMGC